jgi:hypothetical protein
MKKTLIILLFALPGFAFAHDGHGQLSSHSSLHYLLEPAHVLPALAIAVATATLLTISRKAALDRAKIKRQ